MNKILIVCLMAVCIQSQCTNGSVLNRTDQSSVLPIPIDGLENSRVARQQTTLQATQSLVSGILNSVAPLAQLALLHLPLPPDQLLETEVVDQAIQSPPPTAPPQNIKIVIRYGGDDKNSTVIGSAPTFTTTPIPSTNKQPEANPSTIILRYVRPKATTTTRTPAAAATSPDRLPTITRTQPGQILVYLREPTKGHGNSQTSTSNLFPDPSKLNFPVSNFQMSEIKNFANINDHLPENAMAEIKNIIDNRYNQMLKVVEEAEAVRAPISTTQKPYVFLALPLDEYEEFVKYISSSGGKWSSIWSVRNQGSPRSQSPLPKKPAHTPPLFKELADRIDATGESIATNRSASDFITQDPDPSV